MGLSGSGSVAMAAQRCVGSVGAHVHSIPAGKSSGIVGIPVQRTFEIGWFSLCYVNSGDWEAGVLFCSNPIWVNMEQFILDNVTACGWFADTVIYSFDPHVTVDLFLGG